MDFLFEPNLRAPGRFQEWVHPFLGLKSIGCPFYFPMGREENKIMVGIAYKTKKEALKAIRYLRKQGGKPSLSLRNFEWIVTYSIKP